MTLTFVGMGPWFGALTLEALDAISNADTVYIELYTNITPGLSYERLKRITKGNIKFVTRKELEEEEGRHIIEEAKHKNVVLLIGGDPFIATTHVTLRIEALKNGIDVRVVHGVSGVYCCISISGLQVYKFGKMVTLVYPEKYYVPYTTYYVIKENYERGLHTLVLLDIKFDEGHAMRVNEAVSILMDIEKKVCKEEKSRPFLEKVIGLAIARAGTPEVYLKADLLPNLANYNYPPPPHSLIIVSKPHPLELEALMYFAGLPKHIVEERKRTRESIN